MPRHRRLLLNGPAYHLLNRGNRRSAIFNKAEDYQAFLAILHEATVRFAMPLCGVCLMQNHFHLVVWPDNALSISAYMHWLLNAHVHRYHRHYALTGLGHLYQDRYKSFPIQDERYLFTVMRYVEANPLRAGLTRRAEDWAWSTLRMRRQAVWQDVLANGERLQLPPNWVTLVNEGIEQADLQALRSCARRGHPYGDLEWTERVCGRRTGRQVP